MSTKDILTRKRGGFGIYWLAATLGSKGATFRKLTRKEVLGCDVVKAWSVALQSFALLHQVSPNSMSLLLGRMLRCVFTATTSDESTGGKLNSRD